MAGLGPDSARTKLLGRIKLGAKLHSAPPVPCRSFTTPRVSIPVLPAAPVGDPVFLLEAARVVPQYAALLSRALKDPECAMGAIFHGTLPDLPPWLEQQHFEQEISHAAWRAGMDSRGWIGRGMLFPLLVSSPYLESLFPRELIGDVPNLSELLAAVSGARSPAQVDEAVAGLVQGVEWGTRGGTCLAGILDVVCAGAGVLSHRSCSLSSAADSFPDWSLSPPTLHEFWCRSKRAIEGSIPPHALCPLLYDHPGPTWGYPCLSLDYQPGGALRIREVNMQWIASGGDENLLSGLLGQHSRLSAVLFRVGELLMSPEISSAVVCGLQSRLFLESDVEFTRDDAEICARPHISMPLMVNPAIFACDESDTQRVLSLLADKMPRPVHVPGQARLIAWRVDPPPKVVLCTCPDHKALHAPHVAPRVHRSERTLALSASHVGWTPSDLPVDQVVRGGLVRFLRSGKLGGTEVVGGREVAHTAIYEGMFAMGTSEPVLHTQIKVGGSLRWENDYIDPRYAETQEASNGSRYREWVALSLKGPGRIQCKLASHAVSLEDGYYRVSCPWRRASGETEWVCMCSSVKPEFLVLHDDEDSTEDRSFALMDSVRKRFCSDLRLLPVRAQGDTVNQEDCDFYHDPTSRMVLVCYSPKSEGERRLEFVAFRGI